MKGRTEVHTGGGATSRADAVLTQAAAAPAAVSVLCTLCCRDGSAVLRGFHHQALLGSLHRPGKHDYFFSMSSRKRFHNT